MLSPTRGALRQFDDAMDEDDGGTGDAGDDDSTDDGKFKSGEDKEAGGGGGGLVTEETVLEATGEDDLVSVTQLILRNRRMRGFSETCAAGLPNLANLSLSHNRVASLATFGGHFGALLELNLNFNRVDSLEGLVAPLLAKLFLSTNRYVFVPARVASDELLACWPFPSHPDTVRRHSPISCPKSKTNRRGAASSTGAWRGSPGASRNCSRCAYTATGCATCTMPWRACGSCPSCAT